jgi:hypothetical protein
MDQSVWNEETHAPQIERHADVHRSFDSLNFAVLDPSTYLQQYYQKSSYEELEEGISKLKNAIQLSESNQKDMVKNNFAKFVNAKATIDCKCP